MSTLNAKVILNVKTAAEWANSMEILLEGELGIESDTRLIKIGNGVDTYINLPYTAASDINDIEGVTVTNPTDGNVLTYSNGEWVNITPSSLPADTDLSHYDNTTSGFITSADIPALPADTDLSHYDNTNSDFATVSQIPTDVSQLNNDAGYITSADLPTVGNGTITIQANSINIDDFTTNQNSNQTINIPVPTNVSELNNDAGYVTSATLPTVNDGTLIIRQDGNTIATFTANSATNVVANITGGGASFIANAPLNYSGGVLSISAASSSQNGYLSAADWTSFNSKLSSTIFSSNNTWTGTNNVSSLFPRTDNSYSLGANDSAFSEIYANFLYSNANDRFVIGNTSDDNRVLIHYSSPGGNWGIFPDTEHGTASYLGNSVYSWDNAYITNIHFSTDNIIADDPNSTGLYIGWKNSNDVGRYVRFAEDAVHPVGVSVVGMTLGTGYDKWDAVYANNINLSSTVRLRAESNDIGEFYWHNTDANTSAVLQLVGSCVRAWNTNHIGAIDLGNQYIKWGDGYFSGNVYCNSIKFTNNTYVSTSSNNRNVRIETINSSSTQRSVVLNPDYPGFFSEQPNILNLGHPSYAWNVVYAQNGTIQPSDINKKANIVELEDALKTLNSLSVYSYTWRENVENIVYGFIAQEALEKAPELVNVPKEYEEDNGTLGMYTNNVLFLAVKAIQELSSKVDELNAKIKLLEGRV